MAMGSVWRPSRKEPTVWPWGFGGSRGSRGGAGFRFFSCIILITPATMDPPAFSRS